MLNPLFKFNLLATASTLTASQAFAMYGEDLEMSFGDGLDACVSSFGTRSGLIIQPVPGSERPTKQIAASEWVYTVRKFPNEANAGAFRGAKLSVQAEVACERLQSQLLEKLANPGEKILEAVLTWGPKPQKSLLGNSPDYRAFEPDRDCKGSAQQ